MRRREFITLVGGAAAAPPLASHAQQKLKPVIGYLHMASPEPYAAMLSAFRDGLKLEGYVEGQNLTILYRWAEGHPERLAGLVSDLLNRNVLCSLQEAAICRRVQLGRQPTPFRSCL